MLSGVNCGVNSISAPFECPIFPVFIDFFIFYFTYFLIIQDSYGKVNRNVSSSDEKVHSAGEYQKQENDGQAFPRLPLQVPATPAL